MLAFRCSHCNKSLTAKPELAGQKLKCPGCGQMTPAPGTPATPPTEKAPVESAAAPMLSFRCTHCDKLLKIRPELAGKRIKCPGCGQTTPVPGQPIATTPAKPAPPPAVASQETPARKESSLLLRLVCWPVNECIYWCFRMVLKTPVRGPVHAAAMRGLGKLGDARAVDPLIDVLRYDPSTHVCETAARALGDLGDLRAVGPIVAASAWKSSIRFLAEHVAMSALASLGAGAVAPLLEEAAGGLKPRFDLEDESRREKVVAGALAQIGAVEPLLAALKDGRWRVNRAAVLALGEIGDTRAMEPLVKLLGQSWEPEKTKAAAFTALGRLGAVGPLLKYWAPLYEPNDPARAALTNLGTQGVPALLEALRKSGDSQSWEDRKLRRAIIGVLGDLGDPRAVDPLIEALAFKDDDTSAAAASALGQFRDPRAVEPLLRLLQGQRSRTAAGALVRIGDPRAEEPLIAVIQKEGAGFLQTYWWTFASPLIERGDVRVLKAILVGNHESQVERRFEIDKFLKLHASSVSEEDLRKIADLNNYQTNEEVYAECGMPLGCRIIDLGHVRQLARQELIRRGLKA